MLLLVDSIKLQHEEVHHIRKIEYCTGKSSGVGLTLSSARHTLLSPPASLEAAEGTPAAT